MHRQAIKLFALMATTAFAACGESTAVLGELTEVEAQDLSGAVMFATFASSGSVPQPAQGAAGPLAAPFTFATEVDTSVECPGGGVVGVAASLEVSGDTQSEAGHVDYSMSQIHADCVVTSENGRTFTLSGAPSMNVAFAVDNNGQGVVEWQGTVQGMIDWVTDGREGTCVVEMAFSGREEAGVSAAAELTGSVCGFSVAHSVSIG